MGKIGKRVSIANNYENWNVMLLGESGIGKTTLMYKACSKMFGDDGYLLLNCGREDGVKALDGAYYEDVTTFKDYMSIAKELIKNRSEYPNLKVVIADTLDELISLAQDYSVDEWNADGMGTKDFKPAKSINGAWGGFGRGEAHARKLILDICWALKKVGINTWFVGHTKTTDKLDALSGASFTQLSSNLSQKDFDDFKNKMDLVGVVCIDRTIEAEGTGRKDFMTKKEITRNEVKNERRVIKFRDDSYSVDSKSRLASIADEIPLDADEFIATFKNAIDAAKKNPSTVPAPAVAPTPVVTTAADDDFLTEDTAPAKESNDEADDMDLFASSEAPAKNYPENLKDAVMAQVRSADKNTKTQIKGYLDSIGKKMGDLDSDSEYQAIYDILNPAA